MKRRSRKKQAHTGRKPVSKYQRKQVDTAIGRAMLAAMRKAKTSGI